MEVAEACTFHARDLSTTAMLRPARLCIRQPPGRRGLSASSMITAIGEAAVFKHVRKRGTFLLGSAQLLRQSCVHQSFGFLQGARNSPFALQYA
jgi:hypothetical protein